MLAALLVMSSCYNNSHIRTQRVLEPGDKVYSGFASANITGAETNYESFDIRHGGIPGMRAGISYLGHHKGLEQGFNLAYGGGSGEYNALVVGYDLRKVITSPNSTPYRYGVHVEVNNLKNASYDGITGGNVFQVQPYIISTTSVLQDWYGGLHGIMSFGDIESTEEHWSYTTYNSSEFDFTYKVSGLGLGFTIGNEMRLGQFLVQSQVDLSYLSQQHSVNTDDYEAITAAFGEEYLELQPLNSSGPYATLGIALSLAPKSQQNRSRRSITYIDQPWESSVPALKFDPYTGEIITQDDAQETLRFDPLTGLPINEKPLIFDPLTGLPVEQDKPKTPQSLLTPNERSLLLMKGLKIISLNNVITSAVLQDVKDSGLIVYRDIPGRGGIETIQYEDIRNIRFEGGRKGAQQGFKSAATACGTCIGLPLAASLVIGEGGPFALGLIGAPIVGLGTFVMTSMDTDDYELSFRALPAGRTDIEYKKQVFSHLIKIYVESGFPDYDLTNVTIRP